MSDYSQTGNAGAGSNQQSSSDASGSCTLKYVVNRTHLGPVRQTRKAKTLSKAASKIKLTSDLQLVPADSQSAGASEARQGGSRSYSQIILEGGSNTAKKALLVVESWSRFYTGVGTPEYVDMVNALARERQVVYAELGISVQPGKKAPLLTEEQRQFYNKRLLPFAFDYWEHRISYKVPGRKAIRTHTYRSCQEITYQQMERAISDTLEKVKRIFRFS